jgi:hypothetical protein
VDSRVVIPKAHCYSKSKACFYVAIPQTGTPSWRATLRVFSLGATIASFAFGITLFASSQLLSVNMALITIICTVVPAVLGRVLAMWVVLKMNKHSKAILHAVVTTDIEASKHLNAVLKQKGLIFETQGPIIIDGRVICRYCEWSTWSRYAGSLALPYNILKKAAPSHGISAPSAGVQGPDIQSLKETATAQKHLLKDHKISELQMDGLTQLTS